MNITSIVCTPLDSDTCLRNSPAWGSTRTCRWAKGQTSKNYCNTWAKDMRRCCPQACGTGHFTKHDCDSSKSSGTCIYPNDAQCLEDGKFPTFSSFYMMYFKVNVKMIC